MELSKRSLKRGSRVLVVDDFMKGGGTVNGMSFSPEGTDGNWRPAVCPSRSASSSAMMVIRRNIISVDTQTKNITVVPGNYFLE